MTGKESNSINPVVVHNLSTSEGLDGHELYVQQASLSRIQSYVLDEGRLKNNNAVSFYGIVNGDSQVVKGWPQTANCIDHSYKNCLKIDTKAKHIHWYIVRPR